MASRNNIIRSEDFQKNKVEFNIGMGIFIVIFIYLVVSLFMYVNDKHIVGYEVVKGSLSIDNVYTGIILRDEETYSCAGPGYINFFAREGEHLATGDLVYTLDSTGKIAQMIQDSESDTLLADSDLKEIRNSAIQFQSEFEPQIFNSVYTFKNTVAGTTLKLSNYNMLNNMTSLNQAGDNMSFQYCAKSGVLSYAIDGYETLVADQVTKDLFEEENHETNQLMSNQLVSNSDLAYKIIDSENWSIVIPVTKERATALEEAQYVKVRFLKNQYESWAKVTILNNQDGVYCKLDFTNSMITFASDRFINIEILFNQEEGLKVPNSAIAEQEFYLIPIEYKIEGGNDSNTGFFREVYDEDGNVKKEYIDVKVYYSDDENYYVDTSKLRIGDQICSEDLSKKYPISKVGSLIGVYNMNKGYADFTAVTILYSNEEYSIIKSNTKYGLSEYDYIVLNADSVNPDDFIYE